MKKVAVSKLQIAQRKRCIERLDKYVRLLDCIIELLGFTKTEVSYNKLQNDFSITHKKDLDAVIYDLRSMKKDAQEMASLEAEEVEQLALAREKQLEGEK